MVYAVACKHSLIFVDHIRMIKKDNNKSLTITTCDSQECDSVSNVTYNLYRNTLLLICSIWKGEMGRTQIYWLTRDKTVYHKKWTWIISMEFSDYIRVHLFRKTVYYKQKDTNRSNNFNWIFCYYSCPIQKKYVCKLNKLTRMSASTVYKI